MSPETPIEATDGIRYTVPKKISVSRMPEELTVRFRVGAVYQNCYISVYFNDTRVLHRKRPVMAPGEMENVLIKLDTVKSLPADSTLTVTIEEA